MGAASEVQQPQRVMGRCPGVAGQAGSRTFGRGGGGRLGGSGGHRSGLLSGNVFPSNNKICTNPVIGVKVVAVEDNRSAIMNVSLRPELEKFVASEVEAGLYQTASANAYAGWFSRSVFNLSCPQAASISPPFSRRRVALTFCFSSALRKASCASSPGRSQGRPSTRL